MTRQHLSDPPTGQQVYPFASTLAYAKADGRLALGGPGSPYGDLRLKAVCNFGWIKSSAFPPPPNSSLDASYQTPYAEVSHDFHYSVAGIGMQARWGGEWRLNLLQDDTLTENSRPVWNIAGFASNEALLGRWRVTTGLRVDRQTLTDVTFSPRLSAVFSPTPAHQIRAAFNTGYNNPSLVQNYAHLPTATPNVFLEGNPDLRPERIYYGELAYGGTAASWLRLFLNTFAYRMDNSITVGLTPTGPEWANQGGATGYGGEAGFDVSPNRTLSGYANYAYLHLKGDAEQPYEHRPRGEPGLTDEQGHGGDSPGLAAPRVPDRGRPVLRRHRGRAPERRRGTRFTSRRRSARTSCCTPGRGSSSTTASTSRSRPRTCSTRRRPSCSERRTRAYA